MLQQRGGKCYKASCATKVPAVAPIYRASNRRRSRAKEHRGVSMWRPTPVCAWLLLNTHRNTHRRCVYVLIDEHWFMSGLGAGCMPWYLRMPSKFSVLRLFVDWWRLILLGLESGSYDFGWGWCGGGGEFWVGLGGWRGVIDFCTLPFTSYRWNALQGNGFRL